jgi:hypothetical protein
MWGRQGQENVCSRWALWRGMQQERSSALQALISRLRFPDLHSFPVAIAATTSTHACSNQQLFSFLLLPAPQAPCSVGYAGTKGIWCSSRAWCWAIDARWYWIMDVLLHGGHVVDELLQSVRRVICNVVHMGVIDLHELLNHLRRGLRSCEDRNL